MKECKNPITIQSANIKLGISTAILSGQPNIYRLEEKRINKGTDSLILFPKGNSIPAETFLFGY